MKSPSFLPFFVGRATDPPVEAAAPGDTLMPMQRARLPRATPIARWALSALFVVLALAGCKKEGGSSVLDALLPKGTAAKLNKDLAVMAEDLPADLEAIGFIDFGKPLGVLSKEALSYHELIYRDLADMTKRRWGIDVDKLSGAGFVVFQQKPLAVFATASPPPAQGAQPAGEVMFGQVGRLTVLGEPAAVTSIVAAAKQGKRLHQSNPAWLRSALVHSVDNAVFLSGDAVKILASAPPDAKQQLGDLLHGTATIGSTGVAAHLTSVPGSVEKVKALVAMGLGFMRNEMESVGADLPKRGPGSIFAVLYRHYSQALWKSLEQKAEGDEVTLKVGWRMPELPTKISPAPLAERVILPDELAVAQVSFGGPLLEQLIATTDFLAARLDRKALRDELAAELAKLIGVPGVDPSAITASIGPSGFIVSVHNAKLGEPGTPLALAGGAMQAVATPWGLAASPLAPDAITAAMAAKAPGLPIAGDQLLATDDGFVNAFVDMTKLPADLPYPAGLPPLRTISLSSGMSRFAVDVVTAPGQGQALAKWLEGLPALVMPPGGEEMYKNRAQGGVGEELVAIMANFQVHQIRAFTKPKAVNGDRVELRFELPPAQTKMLMMSGFIAGVGVVAAVAIPYFMLRPSPDYPIPTHDDPPPPAPPAEADPAADADSKAAPNPAQ